MKIKYQHIINVGITLIYHSKLPKTFLSYVVSYVTIIINRVNTSLLNHRSSYQTLHDSLPDINLIKVFGSFSYASTLQNHRIKLACKARKSLFIGYAIGYKGFIL